MRYVLDGGLVDLADDLFDVGQNSLPGPLDLLSNDVFAAEYAGSRKITSISYGSEGGSIDIAADGKNVRYAPPADFFGTESFVYVVDDEFTAEVQVRVLAPLAFDSFVIPPDGLQRTLGVLANDPFWPDYGGAREITSVSVASAGGDVSVAADGRSLLYTPPADAFGSDEFIYIVDGIYPARVTVTVPETLKPDQLEVVQHTPGTFNLLANDPFWPGYSGSRRITHVLDADEGATVTISGDGRSITYVPAPDAAWSDSLRYVVDSTYETSANIRIHRPVRDDWFETDENSTNQSFNVLANDTYRDLNNVTRDVIARVTSVTPPASGGGVAISADGQSVIYTPPAGFTGTDEFTYLADGVHEATVRIQVNRPVRDDFISHAAYQDTPNAVLNVLANDFLGNGYTGPKIITAVGPTENGGAASIGGGGQWIVYTPAAGYSGQDAFTYTVDGVLEARVTVAVQPLAVGDSYFFEPDPGRTYILEVLANDNFQQGYQGPGVITAVGDVTGSGQVTIVDGRRLEFVPGSTGAASFTYTVDGQYEAHAWVSLRNRLSGDLVVVDQNSPSQPLDVLANDFAPIIPHVEYPGPRLITSASESRAGGVVTIAPDKRSVNYQPPADFFGDDSFMYSVDGIMQATVNVQVIRRVRDDQFRVDQDAAAEALPVLVNDLFGADYRGAQRITAVSATSAGGAVAISADGRTVQYTPAAGFSGKDVFVYTVDGRLKAEVEVLVGANRDDQFPTFGAVDLYHQFLIDDALVRYAHLFGQPAWRWIGGPTDAGGPPGLGPEDGGRDHSETNVQVAGVDEGDIVEFDADNVYVLTDEDLVIVDAWPAEDSSVASRVDIEGTPVAEFLAGDRLTVISTTGGELIPWDFLGEPVAGGPAVDGLWSWYQRTPSTTLVTVIDVADRTAPRIVQTTSMEGRYVDSRAVGDLVYVLLVSNDEAVAPPPRIIEDEPQGDDDPQFVQGTYETKEEYLARITANPGEMIDAALPNYTAYGADGELVRTGLLNEPEGIYRPLVDDARNLISVVSVNMGSDEPGVASTSAVYATGASAIYASLDNFYVFDADYAPEDGAITRIMKFDWDPATGGIEFAAAGAVAGSLLNQFSADEHDGYLRIAATIANNYSGNWSGRAENVLVVVQEDGGVFEFVGSLQNLALDESLRSVRFMGDRAFLTTYRTIDPLFGLDLSDPANPRALGHLTLPGFSSYMQMIDETHLLTVGENTPTGAGGPTQVALFDVSDLTRPVRVDQYTFDRFSTSEAQIDHHAFGYFKRHGLLSIPVSRTYVERVDEDGDGYRETRKTVREDYLSVLTIDPSAGAAAVELAGEIAHDATVRRSGFIDDYLYSISTDSVKVVRVDAPSVVLAEVIVAAPDDGLPPLASLAAESDVGRFPATISDGAILDATELAQAHLAGRLHKSTGASMVVVAEAAGDATTGGYRVVLRDGDQQYLYYARGDDEVLLANDAYVFPDAASSGAWHAVDAVAPRPGDNDFDSDVDGNDLRLWGAAFGFDAAGDADADGDSDGDDFLAWQRLVPAAGASSSADFDADADVDGGDFLTWQRGVDSPPLLANRTNGDADGDHDVDRGDLDVWMADFGSRQTAAAAPLAVRIEPAAAILDAVDLAPPSLTADLIDAAMALLVAEPSDGSFAIWMKSDSYLLPVADHQTAAPPAETAAGAESDAAVWAAEFSNDDRVATFSEDRGEDFFTDPIIRRLLEPVFGPA